MRTVEEIEKDLATEEGQGGLTRQSPIGRLVADVPQLLVEVEWLHKIRAELTEFATTLSTPVAVESVMTCGQVAGILRAFAAVPSRSEDDRDQADYGPANDQAAERDETPCRTCGRFAIEHTPGRFSIYGTCPSPAQLATRIEFGHQHPAHGWIPEPRGIKYATHQRTVHFRTDEPVFIDHWTYADHRHPTEGCAFCVDLTSRGKTPLTTNDAVELLLPKRSRDE